MAQWPHSKDPPTDMELGGSKGAIINTVQCPETGGRQRGGSYTPHTVAQSFQAPMWCIQVHSLRSEDFKVEPVRDKLKEAVSRLHEVKT